MPWEPPGVLHAAEAERVIRIGPNAAALMSFEYRSSLKVAGLPLVHVVFARDPRTRRWLVARGVIAVGPVAYGVFAAGPVAIGLLTAGQISIGLLAGAGQIAAGFIAAGQLALGGLAAFGQLATGLLGAGALVWSGRDATLLVTAAWVLGAAWLASGAWLERRRVSALLDRRSGRIGASAAGAALLAGRVVPLRLLEAPLSHRRCIAYQLRRGRDADEAASEDFILEDVSGRARVVVSDARFVLQPTHRVAIARNQAVLASPGTVGPPSVGARPAPHLDREELEERILVPGEQVVVAGAAIVQLEGGREEARLSSPFKLVVHRGPGGPVLVTNRPLAELRAEVAMPFWLAMLMASGAVAVGLI